MTTALDNRARELVPAAVFDHLVKRITVDHVEIDHSMAERIMCQTLAFLRACADHPDTRLSPSDVVDSGS